MLLGLKRRRVWFLVNKVYAGTNPKHWEKKRKLLNSIGHHIGEGTQIVGPIHIDGKLVTGKKVWLGKNFTSHGFGTVELCDNVGVGPDVTFFTGSHVMGPPERRSGGKGTTDNITIGKGCMICGRSTIIAPSHFGVSSVLAVGGVAKGTIPANVIVGGVPAKVIKTLEP